MAAVSASSTPATPNSVAKGLGWGLSGLVM